MTSLFPVEVSEPTEQETDTSGSIAYVTARLRRWSNIAPQGMAVVTFESPLARQVVIDELSTKLKQDGIEFSQVVLESQRPAIEHLRRLAVDVLPNTLGVVSITGFQHAFTDDETVGEALRFLNYNRENIVNFPTKQIWWMSPELATYFESVAPELSRYFLVWIRLTEIIRLQDNDREYQTLPEGPLIGQDEAEQLSNYYLEQFERALDEKLSLRIVVRLALKVMAPLVNADLLRETAQLRQKLFTRISQQGSSVDDYISQDLITSDDFAADVANLADIAKLSQKCGELVVAEKIYRNLINAINSREDTNVNVLHNVLDGLAGVSLDQGNLDESEKLLREIIDVNAEVYGPDHYRTAHSLNNLSVVLMQQGKNMEAESTCRRSLNIAKQIFGSDHPKVAVRMNNLARVLEQLGEAQESEKFYRQSIDVFERSLGVDHPDITAGLNNLAGLLIDQGHLKAAEQLLRRALRINEQSLGTKNAVTAKALNNLGICLGHLRKYTEAASLQLKALSIQQEILGDDHPNTVLTRSNYNQLMKVLAVKKVEGKILQPMKRRPRKRK